MGHSQKMPKEPLLKLSHANLVYRDLRLNDELSKENSSSKVHALALSAQKVAQQSTDASSVGTFCAESGTVERPRSRSVVLVSKKIFHSLRNSPIKFPRKSEKVRENLQDRISEKISQKIWRRSPRNRGPRVRVIFELLS